MAQNTAGSGELEVVMGFPKAFDNLRPTNLIKRCLRIAQNGGYVLDFFAGSGMTAQAVLKLNQEDHGNRRFIICTNNEVPEKSKLPILWRKGLLMRFQEKKQRRSLNGTKSGRHSR